MLCGGICTARRKKEGFSYTFVSTDTVLSAGTANESATMEDLLCGERRDARAPTVIFFNMLLEAVIHLAAVENAAEAITTSLGSANKRHKV